jgi:predicted metal-binding membrane protein
VSSAPDLTSRILRHERLIVAAGVLLLALLSWLFVLSGAGMDGAMNMAEMSPPFGAVALMWWVMMVAMMLPSAAPAILLYARVREMRGCDSAIAQSWVFLAGYLGIWLIFSLVAAAAQHLLTGPAMVVDNNLARATLLIAAGVYQLSPVKGACLRECRAPAPFISRHWRAGAWGAVRLGLLHGAYCVGCCWLLMALLFVGGVMNLAWVAALTIVVAAEKLAPGGPWMGRAAGLALIVWGAVLVLA